jgi:hypothetical protein
LQACNGLGETKIATIVFDFSSSKACSGVRVPCDVAKITQANCCRIQEMNVHPTSDVGRISGGACRRSGALMLTHTIVEQHLAIGLTAIFGDYIQRYCNCCAKGEETTEGPLKPAWRACPIILHRVGMGRYCLAVGNFFSGGERGEVSAQS